MTSRVTCGYTGADWEENSHGENACQVYAHLQGLCDSSFVINGVLSSSPPYQPPNNPCGCNVVAYNLQAACGWCQTSILSSWWLTENQWSSLCTAASYDSYGVPTSVTTRSGYSHIDIPHWAFATPTGTTWSPSYAHLIASQYPEDSSSDPGKVAGIAVGVILGFYALLGIVMVVVFLMRQKKRKAWYVPMGQYYAGLRNGNNQPLVYNAKNNGPYSPPPKTTSSFPSSSAYTYQPPPPVTPAPAYTPGYNPGNVPGNTNSIYGGSQPPLGAATPSQGGYKGYAEAH